MHAAVAQLRHLLLNVAVDRFGERATSGLDTRKCLPSIISASTVLAHRSASRRVGKLAVRAG